VDRALRPAGLLAQRGQRERLVRLHQQVEQPQRLGSGLYGTVFMEHRLPFSRFVIAG